MLSGKIAWVTGGGSGIGRGVSNVFAREGANVIVTDINLDGCHKTLEVTIRCFLHNKCFRIHKMHNFSN